MSQTITKGVKSLLAEANEMVATLAVEEASALIASDTHVLVDLREGHERQKTGQIPGAISCTRSMLEFAIDPASPYHKEAFNQDKTYVFYCASGGRSVLAAKTAMVMGLAPVMHLGGGFNAWQKAGGAIESVE